MITAILNFLNKDNSNKMFNEMSPEHNHSNWTLFFLCGLKNKFFPSAFSWEERRTASGRVHYVNHINRTTQWDRPTRYDN